MDQLTFWSEEPPARASASPDCGADWMTSAVTWPLNIFGWLTASAPDGWYGKTSPASCHRLEDGTLAPSSGGWQNSGMGSPGECLTLSLSEWTATLVPSPSDGGVCSLSDILETGAVPPRFFLSAKACVGILRRAEKRGKELPEPLSRALQSVANLRTVHNEET